MEQLVSADLPGSGATVLVTGGAGFIGSTLAVELQRACDARVVAFDSLRRPGSELNLRKLANAGVEFVRGDVRIRDDLPPLDNSLRLIVDCAADPSVLAGYQTPPLPLIGSNLTGTVNCLELARQTGADFVFLSTSRVYPIDKLNKLKTVERDSRFELDDAQDEHGSSREGISERFSLDGIRSLYGATKLASELLVQEYAAMYRFRHVINRLGVVAGPGQMGKVEQGVFALWMARHVFGGALAYHGWGGNGKQVRDLLHVNDVWGLIRRQLGMWDRVDAHVFNVGGGLANSVSLREATEHCEQLTGNRISIGSRPETHPADVRVYYTDNRAVVRETGWAPTRGVREIFSDILQWLQNDETALRAAFGR